MLEAVGPGTVSGALRAVGAAPVSVTSVEAVEGRKNTGVLLIFRARTDAGTFEDVREGTKIGALKKVGAGIGADTIEDVALKKVGA